MANTRFFVALVFFVLVAPASPEAQTTRSLTEALGDEGVAKALKTVQDGQAATANLLVELGGIISPSGAEHDRAQAVKSHMVDMGLTGVTLDETPNVIGTIPGRSGKALVFVATLDDLATVELDLWAAEQGFEKIAANLLGM